MRDGCHVECEPAPNPVEEYMVFKKAMLETVVGS